MTTAPKPPPNIPKSNSLRTVFLKICIGQATLSDMEVPAHKEDKKKLVREWKGECQHLRPTLPGDNQRKCSLLARRQFAQLIDPKTRCTLPMLVKLFDYYHGIRDYYAARFIRPSDDKDDPHGTPAPVGSDAPDFGEALKRCEPKKPWEKDSYPIDWFNFISNRAYWEALNVARKTRLRCSCCDHFSTGNMCKDKGHKVSSTDKKCDKFTVVSFQDYQQSNSSKFDIQFKVIQAIRSVLIDRVSKPHNNLKAEIELDIFESLLSPAKNLEEIGKKYNVSSKTIGRRKNILFERIRNEVTRDNNIEDLWKQCLQA